MRMRAYVCVHQASQQHGDRPLGDVYLGELGKQNETC